MSFTDVTTRPESMRSTDGKDTSKHFFRSQERLFSLNGQWFFATREGDRGPFPTKDIARREVDRYIAECSALIDFETSRKPASRELPSKRAARPPQDAEHRQPLLHPGLSLSLTPMD